MIYLLLAQMELFDELRQKEKWLTIPWKIDILEAREQAAREGKPLFMWAMNGNPLGCV